MGKAQGGIQLHPSAFHFSIQHSAFSIAMSHYDVIIIGGGHNGLVNAAYLARAGRKVLVLERRHVVGGAAVTEEVFPGLQVLGLFLRRVAAPS